MYQQPITPSKGRYYFILAFFALILIALFVRVSYLGVWTKQFLREQGDARTIRTIDIHAHRGMIADRNGKPLAISSPVNSIWISPPNFDINNVQHIDSLSSILSLDPIQLKTRLQKALAGDREFIYLKRQVNPEVASQIEALKIPGVNTQLEYRRFYPEGEATAHLLGITNIDDRGQEGMELAFDHWLRGVPGKKQVIKDRVGRVIANLKTLKEPQPGRGMMLSIDRRIQYLAFTKLRDAVIKHEAKSGSVVVLDTHTGEVLAMVNYPSFNPNARQRVSNAFVRNRAMTDTFEPGSVIKPFSIANALASNQFTPNTLIDTHPGWMVLNNKTIKDVRNFGNLTVESVLTKSSNIGVAKMTLALPPEKLPQLLSEVGFGHTTESDFPGEVSGTLNLSSSQSPIALATLSYGYGLAVTTMQLAHAYSVFANEGRLHPISLFKLSPEQIEHESKQVLPVSIANSILSMLEKAVGPRGSSRRAALHHYRVGGKTGTSRIVGEQGYDKSRHNAFFVGVAPISKPRLTVAVLIHDPQGEQYYGGQVAAPVFAEIMGDALQLLKVAPDKA